MANKAATHPVRLWTAGCSSGEEAYSTAMLLAKDGHRVTVITDAQADERRADEASSAANKQPHAGLRWGSSLARMAAAAVILLALIHAELGAMYPQFA